MKTKTKLMIAAGAAAGAAASYYGVCELAYNRFIRRGPKFFAMGPQEDALTEEQRAERRQRQEAVQSWFAASQVLDLTLTSFDGLRRTQLRFLNHPDSDKWIVMAHAMARTVWRFCRERKRLTKPALTCSCRIFAGMG